VWRLFGILLGWLLAAAIVWLSLTPAPPQFGLDEKDKLGHFAAYAALMFWFCLLYAHRGQRIAYALLWTVMGIVLELGQGQLGYRTYEVYDMYANTLGVLLGWAFSFALPMGFARKLS